MNEDHTESLPTGVRAVTVARPLADALSSPLVDAYRVGGFGLAFLLLGSAMLSGAGLTDTSLVSYILVVAGLILILIPCYFFYIKEVRPIGRARQAVARNEEIINEMQRAAMSTTQLGLMLQAVVYKHSKDVNAVLRTTRAQLRRIPVPFVSGLADQPALTSADTLAQGVLELSEKTEGILGEINSAILESDPTRLKKYVGELEHIKTGIRALLAQDKQVASGSAATGGLASG